GARAPAAPAARSAYDLLWDSGLVNVLALARRELGALFLSPVAYVVGALVIVATSIFGYLSQVVAGGPVSMAGVFDWVAFSMACLTPLLTMRMVAGELRSGTLDLLVSSPVRSWELVLGKWLAGLLFFLASILFTLVYVALIAAQQRPRSPGMDYGAVLTGYVGIVLVGASWVALGILASSLTRSQVIAAVAGIVALLALQYLFGTLAGLVQPPLSDLLEYAGAAGHAQSFERGRLVLRDVVYFLTLSSGALFLAARVVESRRWR
ncbi:MAG TPA: ABC transporter permease, partial [Candidatus Eisenbacteria bacterium]|nr:ABC transporter permease [Candidatus Eisenbacteria bacterium]